MVPYGVFLVYVDACVRIWLSRGSSGCPVLDAFHVGGKGVWKDGQAAATVVMLQPREHCRCSHALLDPRPRPITA